MTTYKYTTGDISTDPDLKRRLGLIPTGKGKLPKDFKYGFATASYQIEGAHDKDGRAPSVWDTACQLNPGTGPSAMVADGTNGDDGINSYYLYPQDIALLKAYGATAYRFSLSWSRLIPQGGKGEEVNEKGVAYYNRLIDALVEAGIEPLVTLFHWDLPTALEEKYGGWSNTAAIVPDFINYARLCFDRFGDRVKHWLTLNEPMCVLLFGSMGLKREWRWERDCYQSAHSLILAHASAVDLYRREFKPSQQGVIGITLNCDWAEPIDDSAEAVASAKRRTEQALGWFADPVYLGSYPQSLIDENPDMPTFTEEEWKIVKGSSDYFGLNSYSTVYTTGKTLRPANGAVFPSNPPPLDTLRPKTNGHANWHANGNGNSNGHANGNASPERDGTISPPSDNYSNMASPLDGYQESTQAANPNLKRRHAGVERDGGESIGNGGECGWLKDVPWGFRKLLLHINERYLRPNDLYLVVTENGFCCVSEADKPVEELVYDKDRVDYFRGYLNEILEAREVDKVDIRGYMAWSLADNFEWKAGFVPRFGCTHVDRSREDMPRTPKDSAWFLKAFFEQNLAKE